MKVSDVVEKYWESVPPAWHATRAMIRAIAAERYDLTVEQFQVLRRIRKGINSVSGLAESSMTSRSSVSKAVDGLVNKELVKRSTDVNDRRNIPLSLTLAGDKALTDIFNAAELWLEARFDHLDEESLVILVQGMALLQDAFDKEIRG